MVKQHELKPPHGAHRHKRRLGRGNGSGRGNMAGRGMSGQKSRSGSGPRSGFEGGQLPLVLRLPTRRGFKPLVRHVYQLVKLEELEDCFDAGSQVTLQELALMGLIRDPNKPVKVLADGELTKALLVTAHRFSASAKAKIQAAGGQVEELEAREETEAETPEAAKKGTSATPPEGKEG
ncbi:MAG: 50S ribosomal protein L15 [Chloroflexi bacterium]|nr:50S ribosomal protein L15 [Chloroflexota bacterium]